MNKISLSMDIRVLHKADIFVRKKGMKRGELILIALKSLNDLPTENWKDCVPDNWLDKRVLKETSFTYPAREESFINKIKNNDTYPFAQTVEIALWNNVSYLKPEALKPKNKFKKKLYKCKKCLYTFTTTGKTECPICKGDALTLKKSEKNYYNWKLKKTLEYLQHQYYEAPNILDINSERIKSFLIRKLKQEKRSRTGDYFNSGLGHWLLKLLEGFGDIYVKEDLRLFRKKKAELKKDWFQALEFFLWHAYFQGRGDELGQRYFESAQNALIAYFGEKRSLQNKQYNIALKNNWIPQNDDWEGLTIRNNDLWKSLKKKQAGTKKDMEMVLDSLYFISECPNKNIILYILNQIKKRKIEELINDIKSIHKIKHETVLWFIQDVALLFNLKLPLKDHKIIIPMNNWVKGYLKRIGISLDENSKNMPSTFFKACNKLKIDPKKVNAGALYLGDDLLNLILN